MKNSLYIKLLFQTHRGNFLLSETCLIYSKVSRIFTDHLFMIKNLNSHQFRIGQKYTTEQIKAVLGKSGTFGQVVVLNKGKVVCIRFKKAMNPKSKNKCELWIKDGPRRIPDALKWVSHKAPKPIFCSGSKVNSWEYLGIGTATVTLSGVAAAEYANDPEVRLIAQMHFVDISEILKEIGIDETYLQKKAA